MDNYQNLCYYEIMYRYKNPVIPGFNPDPSICRNGDDYYLVTSSFEFFPGVPVYHSKNLIDWKMIGHCLNRKEQLPLEGCHSSGGIYAPTIRYHDGMFYMITTNVSGGGNFIVHAENPAGPWSNPVYIAQGGIDPSLLFIDGKAYFCSNGGETPTDTGVHVSEIDPITGKKLSASRLISGGTGGRFAEAPHIYWINGWYYLLLAEGGTEYGHMVTIQRSRDMYGPYEKCPHNPILSHRDRGGHPIQATGHADIIEDHNGAWWMVCLGIRVIGGAMLHNLGRETFLLPLEWKDGWPVTNGVELIMEAPLPASPLQKDDAGNFTADFCALASTGGNLGPEWTYIRNPDAARYQLRDKRLWLLGNEKTLSSPKTNPVFTGVRQQQFCCEAHTKLDVGEASFVNGTRAGITAFYNEDYHYEIFVERDKAGVLFAAVNKRVHDMECITFREAIPESASIVELRITADRERYSFSYKLPDETEAWHNAGSGLCAGLCTEGTHTMTFTGVFIGLFASGGSTGFLNFDMR